MNKHLTYRLRIRYLSFILIITVELTACKFSLINMVALLWESKQLCEGCFVVTSIRYELLGDVIQTLEHGDQLRLMCWSPARGEFLTHLRRYHFVFREKKLFPVAMHLAEIHVNENAKRPVQIVARMQN